MYRMDNPLMASPPSYLSRPNLISPSSIAITSYEPDFSKAIASIIWSRHRTQTTCVIFKCNVNNCPLCPSDIVNSTSTPSSKRVTRSQRRKFVLAKRSVEQKKSKSTTASAADWPLHLTSATAPYRRPSHEPWNFNSDLNMNFYPNRLVQRPDWPWMSSPSSYSLTTSPSSSRSVSPASSVDVNSRSVDTISSCKLTSFLSSASSDAGRR
eukprot:XP_011679474.1 PREDICTED: uncharacterized protein LOC105445522 [Strongylocentrotus purpuratus]